jgi:hypothetical protein
MSAIGITDNPVLAGSSTPAQVTINGPAPSGGQPVTLQSSDSTVTVPTGGVVVAAGQTTAGFSVGTTNGAATTATLTASIGGSNVSTNLSVVDHPSVASVTLDRQCFTSPDTFSTNRVTLDVAAPVNTVVALSSSASSALSVPSSVMVPSGSKSAFFDVNTFLASPLVTVTAALAPSPSATDTASVRDGASPAPKVTDLTLNPDSVTAGGSSIGTVTLDCEALSGGADVSLQSSDTSVATVVSPVNVPEDQLSTTFNITVVGVGTTTITATGPSGPPETADLQVLSQPN